MSEYNTYVFDDGNIGNGDPILAVTYSGEERHDLVMLGTGFESYMDALDQVCYSMRTGDPTQDIHRENAESLAADDPDSVEVFTLGASATMEAADE